MNQGLCFTLYECRSKDSNLPQTKPLSSFACCPLRIYGASLVACLLCNKLTAKHPNFQVPERCGRPLLHLIFSSLSNKSWRITLAVLITFQRRWHDRSETTPKENETCETLKRYPEVCWIFRFISHFCNKVLPLCFPVADRIELMLRGYYINIALVSIRRQSVLKLDPLERRG